MSGRVPRQLRPSSLSVDKRYLFPIYKYYYTAIDQSPQDQFFHPISSHDNFRGFKLNRFLIRILASFTLSLLSLANLVTFLIL